MPPPDSAHERTRLSWRRTSLVATVVAILLVRLALHEGRGVGVIGVAALCWVGLLVVVQRRVNALTGPVGREIVLTAAACVAFGVLGVVLVVR
ncbi:DUF202 domain-containing protein [Allorhizocola rhizosphaerae]|uniref:DUF202 domain-containing protein n=1 Tax=Allorhizocola rhizosphaerae TaxID=1872709 RepID=UPI000E3C016C|nr:DUF202 domain-containing protein [Allorhizocola rhizosphaerae]